MARKVYGSQVLRKRLINFCPPLYRSAMDRILFNDLILMRLMSCDYRLLPSKIGNKNHKKFLLGLNGLNSFQMTCVRRR